MRHRPFFRKRWLAGALGALSWFGTVPTAGAALIVPPTPQIVQVRLVQDPVQPIQPVQPVQPQTTAAAASDLGGRGGLDTPIGRGLGSAERTQAASSAGSTGVVPSGFNQTSTDVGNLLSNAQGDAGVEVQRRSPIITDPRVRGYHVGQLLTVADHGYYMPARNDIDTLISKFDPGNIRDVIVVKGPYSVRYGPGFSFLDIVTYDAPRYECGYESHGITSLNYRSNGENIRGRQTFMAGDRDWGVRLGYSINTGNDYTTGTTGTPDFNPLRDTKLPSSFNSQNVDFAFGYDLSENTSIALKGFFLHQQNVELPGLFFDINDLETQSYSVFYEARNQSWFDRFTVAAWYNYTNLQGDSFRPSKGIQVPLLANFDGRGNPLRIAMESGIQSYGYQTAMTWGKERDVQVTVGSDLRYLSQRMFEFDAGPAFSGNFPIPRSHVFNPGLFADVNVPMSCYWTVRAGARYDFVSTDIDEFPADRTFASIVSNLGTSDFKRDFSLFSGYLSSELQVSHGLKLLAGAGVAQRPPMLTELYAVQPFLGVIQNSFNFVTGDPTLNEETLYQFDLGFRWEEERFRAGVSGYYASVHDYITYDAVGRLNVPNQPSNIGLDLQTVNTKRATLTGFEAYAEFDVLDWLTPFGQAFYVRGTDENRGDRTGNFLGQTIGAGNSEPLPGIIPLEGRLGLRIHEPGRDPRWSVEGSARMVDRQNRVAASLGEEPTPGFTTFDVRGFWQVNQSLNVSAGVENVFDRFYREHLDYRTGRGVFQPGRTVYVGAELRY